MSENYDSFKTLRDFIFHLSLFINIPVNIPNLCGMTFGLSTAVSLQKEIAGSVMSLSQGKRQEEQPGENSPLLTPTPKHHPLCAWPMAGP